MLNGKKTKLGGGGLMLLAIVQVALGYLGYPEYSIPMETALQMFLGGLGIVGIGHKIEKTK